MLTHIVTQLLLTGQLTIPQAIILALLLADWVKKWRNHGLSDGDLAEQLEVDVRTIERWRTGKTKRPHLDTLPLMQKMDMQLVQIKYKNDQEMSKKYQEMITRYYALKILLDSQNQSYFDAHVYVIFK